MRLLMIYVDEFSYETSVKGLESAEDKVESAQIKNALIGFIHVEEKDEENLSKVETKLIKHLKWAARKNNTNHIVLHSFAHLSESKANPDKVKILFGNAKKRLENSDYVVSETPFGYFLDLHVDAPGHSFARLYKEF